MSFLSGIANKLWGLSSGAELRKFLYLAAGGFCLFGSFSPLKPLKESLFINMVGSAYLPVIKGLSAVLMLLVVVLYSKVVDLFSKRNLFYVVLSFYVALGLLFVVLLSHPTIGIANTAVSLDRWVAWGFYLF
ncbi:MAG: antiporter, family, partial [Candidatus Dependentiae bacterium]|nr:antiporter, family [Candidatus Dependentiae bacterium]